jgi:ABC-type Zn uptake system ZnuABC Zn-binding protein ZnuA
MMKKVMGLILVGALLAACQPAGQAAIQPTSQATQSGGATTALKVVAAETFLADIAQNVAGDRIKIESLMPIGVDPHGFEPTPTDVAKVADSNVLIVNGAGFEEFMTELLKNAGGQRTVIEASAGLTSREAREGEEAVMSEADLAAAMCAAASESTVQDAASGVDAKSAAELPAEVGLFNVALTKQADGTYAGYLKYVTDESGDFQVVMGTGQVTVSNAADGAARDIEKTLAVNCPNLTQGNIIELEKDGQYVIALTGFTSDQATLLIGPAGGHHHHEGDPHFWLDPQKVIKYVENIRDGLSAADPAGAAVYKANADAYIAKLKELDLWITDRVKEVPEANRKLVTNHESFGYFADRYGFQVIGTVVPSVSTGSAPSAQQLARLIDHIKETGAKAIFLETGANPQLAQQVAREAGVTAVTELYSHSITEAGGAAPTYLDMMKFNTDAIVSALK